MDRMLAADQSSSTSMSFAQQNKEVNDGMSAFETGKEPDDFWNKLISKNQNEAETTDENDQQQGNG